VGNSVARVNDGSGQRAIRNLVRGPGGSEGEHCLDGNVETLDVKRFEKDLCSLFPIFWCVERRLGLRRAVGSVIPLVRSNFGHAPARSSDLRLGPQILKIVCSQYLSI